jgi:hypothetical protein
MLSKGEKKTYLSQLGYIERNAFDKSFSFDTNPLARYAIFEALSGGGGSDVVSPEGIQEKINSWKLDKLSSFKSELLKSSLKKQSAYLVFVFLIGLVLDLIIESGINAFL